jgi:5-oxoprolinase (ATP-hydrolysing) subunit C
VERQGCLDGVLRKIMGALLCQAPGISATIQDHGRHGYLHYGMPASGALDPHTATLLNKLAGNTANEAVLEFFYRGPKLKCVGAAVRIVAGADARITGPRECILPAFHSRLLHPDEAVEIGPVSNASCSYLAVEGGFAVEPVLGSRSTYLRGGIGGFQGRSLMAGDLLQIGCERSDERQEVMLATTPTIERGPIRVVLGPQESFFDPDVIEQFLGDRFTVTSDADRIGMRLNGPLLRHNRQAEIMSEGNAIGSIQVPGNGQAIILLADRQTVGGYPKIATVISADIARCATMPAGSHMRFCAVSPQQGLQIERKRAQQQEKLIAAIVPQKKPARSYEEALMTNNIIDGVVSATGEDID